MTSAHFLSQPRENITCNLEVVLVLGLRCLAGGRRKKKCWSPRPRRAGGGESPWRKDNLQKLWLELLSHTLPSIQNDVKSQWWIGSQRWRCKNWSTRYFGDADEECS